MTDSEDAVGVTSLTKHNEATHQSLETIQKIRHYMNSQVIGQEAVIDQIIMALLCNGHVLLEGVPGLGKTLLVRTLAKCFGGEFKRIQFTPDLMPTDITGHVLFDMKESRFKIRRGPVFTHLLLADEINRAPAKTQAALLEVMQERQVTLEGSAKPLPKPFMVLATQNPIEQEGTYPLPEAQLDRFLLKILLDYPTESAEMALTQKVTENITDDTLALDTQAAFLTPNEVEALQVSTTHIVLDEQVSEYAVKIVRATRDNTYFLRGAGTRACLALVRAARAHALMRGSSFVLPDDVKTMALPVLRHRVALSAEMEIDGFTIDTIIQKTIETVDAPRL